MDRKKKAVVIVSSILVLYSLIGFVVIPLILESILPEKLSRILHRQVTINNIYLNPLSLSAAVEGVRIQENDRPDPFVSFDELYINVQLSSLLRGGLVLKAVRLDTPDIRLVRISETRFNFSDLIPETPAEEKTAEQQETKETPFLFSISNIAVTNGRISLDDQLIQKQHVFSDINLMLPRISNFDAHIESFSAPRLTGNFNQAGLSIDMETKPFHDTLETTLHLTVTDFDIPYYFSYIPKNMVGFEVRSGKLKIDARMSHINKNSRPEIQVQGKIALSNLEISEKDKDKVLTLAGLEVDVAPSHPLDSQLKLASVKIMSPELIVRRDSKGVINLTTLGPKPAESDDASELPTEKEKDNPSATEKAFVIDLAEFILDSGRIVFKDNAVSSRTAVSDSADEKTSSAEMSVDDLKITISDFSTRPDHMSGYDVHARINKEAAVLVSGRAGIAPLKVETDFNISGLKLFWGQPYVSDTVGLVILDGQFISEGHANVTADDSGEVNASVTASMAVNGFKAVDSSRNEIFAAWQRFAFDGIDVSINPLKVTIDKIKLKDFTNQLIVLKDGTTNIDAIFKPSESKTDSAGKPPGASQAEASQPVIPVRINEVLLDNADFQFKDMNIEPHFATRFNLSDLRITGLTSEDFKAADITGKGKIDAHAPVKINGQVNPLKEDLFLDIFYSLENMELAPLSPYTGKYIGRMIQKGKLSTDIAYKIDQKTITAKNRILLDQFTLGKKVDSKDAVNLPVGVAIALLKDRNGKINVDLPISGRTDDPEFKFGKTLVKTLSNLIVKAAASPFDLVGSVVGGGEELRFIEFDPADTTVNAAAVEKLNAVKKLMYERPGLTLEIAGYVDMERDSASLKEQKLSGKVKILKDKKAAQDPAALAEIVLTPAEYEKLLRKVFKKDVLSDPEKKKALQPANNADFTIQEMETLIKQEIMISDADLRLVALERAREVKNYLLQDETIAADRLFLKEPESLSPSGKDEFQAARAELNVR